MCLQTKWGGLAIAAALLAGLMALPGRVVAQKGPETEDAAKVASYVKQLTSKDTLVRKQVARALGAMGARARTAVPALREALLDADEAVRTAAAAALEEIGSAPPRDGREQLRRALEAAEEQRAELARLLEEARAKLSEQEKQLRVERARALEARDAEAARHKELQEVLKKLEAESRQARAAAEEAAAEADRRRREAQRAQDQAAVQDKRMLDLERRLTALMNRSVTAEVEAKMLQERNAALLQRIKELEAQQPGAKSPAGTPGAQNPPPTDVEGMVVDVNPETGLVKLSLGSDGGLARGHTLEVFRLKPEPKYLGTVVVVEVHPKEAIAKPVKPLKAGLAIQKGDHFASRILGRR
jgi:hypothetical protein